MEHDLTSAIVRILTSEGGTAGTGFLISAKGLIVTCAHVVQGAEGSQPEQVDLIFHGTQDVYQATIEPKAVAMPVWKCGDSSWKNRSRSPRT